MSISDFDCHMCSRVYENFTKYKKYPLSIKQFSQIYGLIFINYIKPVGYDNFGAGFYQQVVNVMIDIGLAYQDYIEGNDVHKYFSSTASQQEINRATGILEKLKSWNVKLNW